MIARRYGGATSHEATGKFSSPEPLPDRCCAASSVMGCLVSQTASGMRPCGEPEPQRGGLMTVYGPKNCPRRPIPHDLAARPALVPPHSAGQIGRESR